MLPESNPAVKNEELCFFAESHKPSALQSLIVDNLRGKPAIMSTQIAEKFSKRHDNIVREIRNLRAILPKTFDLLNFEEIKITDSQGRKYRGYLLTRDAFTLLAMGFTGREAIIWKLRFIEAFNLLEKAASENGVELARQSGYEAGRADALSLPTLEAERRKGYQAGLAEGRKLAKKEDRLYVLERLICYARARLSSAEMGRCLGISANAVQKRIASFKKKGYWPKDIVPVQASLPGVK